MMQKILFVASILLAALAYQVWREPVPDGANSPWSLRWFLFQIRVNYDYRPLLAERFGVGSNLEMKREFFKGQPSNLHEEDVQSYLTTFDGVPVRIYEYNPSVSPASSMPGLIYFHGGGWVHGGIDYRGEWPSRMAYELKAKVVSVGYRLAPEHSYWDAFDDCVTSTKYMATHAMDLGINPGIGLVGESAGGQLVLAVALKLRDTRFQPQPRFLASLFPVVQALDLTLPSYQQNADGPVMPAKLMPWFFSNTLLGNDSHSGLFHTNMHVSIDVQETMAQTYLDHKKIPPELRYQPYEARKRVNGDLKVWNQIKDTVMDPYFSPLLADNLTGLPPTLIYTAKYDVLRDEGILMAQRLREAGVSLHEIMNPIGWHVCHIFFLHDPDCESVLTDILQSIRELDTSDGI